MRHADGAPPSPSMRSAMVPASWGAAIAVEARGAAGGALGAAATLAEVAAEAAGGGAGRSLQDASIATNTAPNCAAFIVLTGRSAAPHQRRHRSGLLRDRHELLGEERLEAVALGLAGIGMALEHDAIGAGGGRRERHRGDRAADAHAV